MLGDRARAGKVFSAALAALAAEKDAGVSRPDYGSRLRDAAAVLALVAEANLGGRRLAARTRSPRAGAVLDAARAERSLTSTQENGWMVLAAEALAEHGSLGRFSVDGEPVKGALNRRFGPDALDGKTGDDRQRRAGDGCSSSRRSPARRSRRSPPRSNGYAVERTFYTLDGKKLDLEEPRAERARRGGAEGDGGEARYARLLIVDRLPAGLEIDNPALVDGGSVEGFSWLTTDETPAHTEYRDDRFVAVFDRRRRPVGLHHPRLCRPRRRARPLRLAARDRRGHVRPRALRPHRLRRDGGDGEVRRMSRPRQAGPALAASGRLEGVARLSSRLRGQGRRATPPDEGGVR